MSKRERILLIVGAILVIGLGFYYYVYSPRQAEYQQLRSQLADREDQLLRMQNAARQATRLEQEYARLQQLIARLETKLPAAKETPSLLVQLERLTKSLRIDLLALRPEALEAAQSGTTGGTAATGAYQRFPIKLTITATYQEMLMLTNALHEFPRLIRVRRMRVVPKAVPDLSVDLDVETFVLPKGGR